jgi:hypothetical protein
MIIEDEPVIYSSTWPNRTACDAMEEIRTRLKQGSYSDIGVTVDEVVGYLVSMYLGLVPREQLAKRFSRGLKDVCYKHNGVLQEGDEMKYLESAIRGIIEVSVDMKECTRVGEYSMLTAHIERAQSLANVVEAGLNDKNDLDSMVRRRKNIAKEVNKLEVEKNRLRDTVAELTEQLETLKKESGDEKK